MHVLPFNVLENRRSVSIRNRLQGYNNKLPQLHSCESPQLHENFFLQNSGAKILHLAHIHNDNFEKNSDKKGRIKKNP